MDDPLRVSLVATINSVGIYQLDLVFWYENLYNNEKNDEFVLVFVTTKAPSDGETETRTLVGILHSWGASRWQGGRKYGCKGRLKKVRVKHLHLHPSIFMD